MSLLARLRSPEERSYWIGPYNIKDPLTGIFSDRPALSGVTVNEYTALNYSAVWAAIQRIAGDVASLPLVLYRRTADGGKEPMRDHPLYRLLHDQPNPEMTAVVFRETLQAHLLSWGGAYAEIEWTKGGPARAIWPIAPNRVSPKRDPSGYLYYEVQNNDGRTVQIEPENMLHIPGLGFDGTCGYSVVHMARESIGLGIATERFGSAWFGNGSSFGGILTHPGRLSPEARKNIRESINAIHGGVGRNSKLGLLEEGMTYTPTSVPPDDAQFLETRKFQVTEIARWFQIPPHMLADLERATFSNIEQQQIDYYTGTLRRWLVRWEQEINRKLVLQNGTQFVEHVIDGLLRGDIESRYQAYAVGRQWGWLSADDVRAKENMNPLPEGGDIYLVPINMAPADRINEIVDKQVEPEPAPQPVVGRAETDTQWSQAVLGQIELLRQEHADRLAKLSESTDTSREAVTGEIADSVAALRSDMATVEQARSEAERKASESGVALEAVRGDLGVRETELAAAKAEIHRLLSDIADLQKQADIAEQLARERERQANEATAKVDALRQEWIAAQQKHQERIEAELTERARLQADLTRQTELVQALESDVAAGTKDLDEAREAHANAVRMAEEAREAERVALSEKVVSAEEAKAARERAEQAEERAEAAGKAASDYAREVNIAKASLGVATDNLRFTEAKLAETSTELINASQTNAERAEALLKLEAEARQLQDALDRERATAKAAQDAVAATETRAAATEDRLKQLQEQENARLAGVLGAHRALIADAVGRMARRQAEKARRYQATPEKLRRWLETYATVEQPICVEALLPAVRTHLVWMQSKSNPSEVTSAIVKNHLDLFAVYLGSAASGDPEDFHATLEAVLQRWEADRPNEVADAILQEGIAYVRARSAI